VPVYPPFLSAPAHSHRRLLTVPLEEAKSDWVLDLDRLADALTPRTRMFVLCSPHNPTGRIYSRLELENLADVCLRNDLVVCSDEIHCDLILDSHTPHTPFASLGTDIARRTITLMAPSKTYNLPGLGCAFAVIPDAGLRRRFRAACAGIVPSVNLFGYAGALAAYRHGHGWLAALLDYLRMNRESVLDAVGRMPGLCVHRPQATYLAWIDTRASGIDDPVAFFEKAGVGLNDGADFGGPGFVRLNFGCPGSILKKALGKMTLAANRLAGSSL
jgi:cystathionine beta-lyase